MLALLPTPRQRVVFLKLRGLDWLLIAGALLVSTALLLTGEIAELIPIPHSILTLGEHASLLTLGIVLLVAVWLWFRIQGGSIPVSRTPQLVRAIEAKLLAGEPNTAVELLREGAQALKHKPTDRALCRILCARSRQLENTARRRIGLPEAPIHLPIETLKSCSLLQYGPLTRLVNRLALWSVRSISGAKRRSLERLYLNRALAEAASRFDPILCFELFDPQRAGGYAWMDNSLRAQILDTQSTLAQELHEWDNNPGAITADDNDTLPLLAWLFADCRRARNYSAWQSIGDATKEMLQQYAIDSATSPYNIPMISFYERSMSADRAYLAITYFDVMVTSALHQGVQHHMFLYYYPYLAREMVPAMITRNESGDEWESRYEFLLYSMFSRAKGWVRAATALSESNPHTSGSVLPISVENDNIPNCAIDAMAQMLRELVQAPNVRAGFKQYIADTVFGLYFELCRAGQGDGRALTLLRCLRAGGSWGGHDAIWASDLRRLWDEHDKVHHMAHDQERLRLELFREPEQ